MIQEDYVSFETTKLLKEKGFDEPTLTIYRIFDDDLVDMIQYNFALPNSENSKYDFACPTLQMAMKWLREVHNLHITIKIYTNPNRIVYAYEIDKLGHTASALKLKSGFENYEVACEAAIKYTLEHLI